MHSVIRKRSPFIIALAVLLLTYFIGNHSTPTFVEQRLAAPSYVDSAGLKVFENENKNRAIESLPRYQDSPLRQSILDDMAKLPQPSSQWVNLDGEAVQLTVKYHLGLWSLLPAFLTIALCLLYREPLPALFAGIVTAAFLLGKYDITDNVLQPTMATQSAAGILLLYLWLLGGLLGVWSKTGAAQSFAELMTERFVTGPRSAKLVTWCLGVLFFQGGTISTVLVGTTVKPMADKAGVSHEELAYVVDSTASPIASVLAFNAWPAYVQALIFVPGVSFLATEADRIAFFFSNVIFSFYGIFAVLGTLLLSLNITRFSGPLIRQAHQRAKTTQALDAPNAKPISSPELHLPQVPDNYTPNPLEFIVPLVTLIATAVVTFVILGSPKINWAFGAAFAIACTVALWKGLSLEQLLDGIGNGLKGAVTASVILVMAIALGALSKELGAGLFVIQLLGDQIPYYLLPVFLQILTMLIAFSTGTSWGTYAIAFPLAMPLAWYIADIQQVEMIEMYMGICFAAVLNGSVYGDQCSPISDTTILSAMTTGCDLMDHVKSQIIPATYAALLAATLWTIFATLCR